MARAVPRPLAAAALALLTFAPARAADPRPSLSGARRWACFYGGNLSRETLGSLDLAILDPDHFALERSTGSGRGLLIAYVSAGEAQEDRAYWASVKGKPFLVEPNPDWPGAHRADIRSEAWRGLLLGQVIPSALAKGYRGIFLDTLDTAEYLEDKDPARFAGSLRAAADFLEELRSRHPGILILVNNAFPLLESSAGAIDGAVVEDLYTRCLPRGPCGETPGEVSREKEKALRRFRERTGKPVFVLLYGGLSERDVRWMRRAVRRCRANGFLPYLATPSLDRLGVVSP